MKIKLEGKDIFFGFGLHFLGRVHSEMGMHPLFVTAKIKSNTDIVDLMYISARSEHFLDDRLFPFTKRDFIEKMLEDPKLEEHISEFWGHYQKTVQVEFLDKLQEAQDEEKKKKK